MLLNIAVYVYVATYYSYHVTCMCIDTYCGKQKPLDYVIVAVSKFITVIQASHLHLYYQFLMTILLLANIL